MKTDHIVCESYQVWWAKGVLDISVVKASAKRKAPFHIWKSETIIFL